MAKFCIYCGAELPDDMLFCTSCGRKLEEEDSPKMCPRCGRVPEPEEQYCIMCGYPLAEGLPCAPPQEEPPRPVYELRANGPAREEAPDQEEAQTQAPRDPVREESSVLPENTIRADREIPAEKRPPAIHTRLPYQSGGAERPEETSPEERREHILQILGRKSEAEMESSMSDTGFFSAGNL